MHFNVLNTQGFPNEFLVVIGTPILRVSVEGSLSEINAFNKKQNEEWTYVITERTDEALQVQREGLLFLVAEYGSRKVDVPELVKHFQLPVLLLKDIGPAYEDTTPSLEILASDTVYGYIKDPTTEELFVTLSSTYWEALATKALRDASMMLGGAFDGK